MVLITITRMPTGRKRNLTKANYLRNKSGFFNLKGEPDKNVLFLVLGLCVFGLLMVYSASFINHTNPFHFFIRQSIYFLIGVVLAIMAYGIDYRILLKLIGPGIVVSIILLVAVLIPGIGKTVQGSSRWIDLQVFDLQPSEVAKISFIAYLAAWASKQKQRYGFTQADIVAHIKEDLLPFVAVLGLICILVLLEPDLATTGIIGVTAIAVYFLSGRDVVHSIGTITILIIMIIAGVVAGILEPYRFERIQTYVSFLSTGEVQDPTDSGYQLKNVLTAVGTGGWFGVGYGESRQKFHYLGDTGFSDNIFAVIAEEFGLVGSFLLVSTYFYIGIRGIKVAGAIDDRFAKLLAAGIIIWLVLQAFLHMGANIGLIPVTGITLPFISYGGSSMVVTMVAIGLYLNVSRLSKAL
jgi:cell division protein FtsW